jgi:FAD/FMN-containing dehydrogenase
MSAIAARSEADYESWRQGAIWNAVVPSRFPDAIARPASRDEVAKLVRDAAARGRRIGVTSGGHSWRGAGIRDGGLLLALGALQQIEVLPEERIAFAEPGATHKMLADAIVPHGLGFPIGHCPTVGLGGYLLAGGFGWNKRTWGPAVWSVEGHDVVTVDGDEIQISPTEQPDLYWAARGGGGGFPGVVTRYRLRLKPLPKIVAARVVYPLACLPELLVWAGGHDRLPPGIEISLIARRPVEPDPGDLDSHGRAPLQVIVAMTGFGETVDAATEIVTAAVRDAPCCADVVTRSVEEEALSALEGPSGWIHGLRYQVDCVDVDDLETAARACEGALRTAPSDLTRIVFAGGFSPGDPPDVAVAEHGRYSVNVYATWADPSDDAANAAWMATTMAELEPITTGYYIGESDLSAGPDRARRSYTPAAWERLNAIRAEHDPQRRKFGFLGEDEAAG